MKIRFEIEELSKVKVASLFLVEQYDENRLAIQP